MNTGRGSGSRSGRHTALPPCVVFEDEHLLVVNKPAGWNTHAPAPHAGEGIYDWLRHREPRWADLAIIHRLDKETSGLLVFALTPLANRSLTQQFEERQVRKRYTLVTDRVVPEDEVRVVSEIVRAGERYVSRPWRSGNPRAETRFRVTRRDPDRTWVEAEPLTGRTHQLRVHAAALAFPIHGDTLYGGTPAGRVWLHAGTLSFRHPATEQPVAFEAPADFDSPSATALRAACVAASETDSFRLIHGAADGFPGWYVDRLAGFVLSQSEQDGSNWPVSLGGVVEASPRYHRRLRRSSSAAITTAEASPVLVSGAAAPERFVMRENGVRFELSVGEGGSVGLFLDQRDNRRRLLVNHVAARFPLFAGSAGHEVLNCFAYTCGFSVCAALAGARTTSLDLSRKYLDWGRRNFVLNDLDPGAHEFLHGDVFDWFRRLGRKGRQFDAVLLDPPTFSRSKERGDFRAESDYGDLVRAASTLVKPGGVLFASTNAARLEPERFLEEGRGALRAAGRRITAEHYVPQPPDFPVARQEPAYLKTVWIRMG